MWAALALAALVACGKKGPPLAPLNLVPDRPAETTGHVLGDTAYLALTVPSRNAGGTGALALDHLEVYAITVDAGAMPPPNRDLLTPAHAIARIPIKPPVDPDAPPEDVDEGDTRPAAGDKIVFAEPLTDAVKTPQVKAPPPSAKPAAAVEEPPAAALPANPATTAAPVALVAGTPAEPVAPVAPLVPLSSPESVPAAGAGGGGGVVGVPTALPPPSTTAAGAEPPAAAAQSATVSPTGPTGIAATAAAAAAKPAPTVTRVYIVRGMTKKGHPGTPSARVTVPIVPPPSAPADVTASFTESAVTIAWKAPEAQGESAAPLLYNVYASAPAPTPANAGAGLSTAPVPLNPAPLEALTFEHAGAESGKEQCFVVRSVEKIGSIAVESAPSARACVTPVDRFAPAAPSGLAAVATTGAVNLIWDANTEADIAGYVVLRGESPGDTLQPLTPAPIHETRFRDATAVAGVRYAYAIIAVDRAGNRSAASARVEETAR